MAGIVSFILFKTYRGQVMVLSFLFPSMAWVGGRPRQGCAVTRKCSVKQLEFL